MIIWPLTVDRERIERERERGAITGSQSQSVGPDLHGKTEDN
jgi:hypothetical protein